MGDQREDHLCFASGGWGNAENHHHRFVGVRLRIECVIVLWWGAIMIENTEGCGLGRAGQRICTRLYRLAHRASPEPGCSRWVVGYKPPANCNAVA
jgi:hypothetical protein